MALAFKGMGRDGGSRGSTVRKEGRFTVGWQRSVILSRWLGSEGDRVSRGNSPGLAAGFQVRLVCREDGTSRGLDSSLEASGRVPCPQGVAAALRGGGERRRGLHRRQDSTVARGRGTHDVPRGRSVPCARRPGFAVTLLRETWSSHIRIRNGSRRHVRVAEPGRWPGRRVDSGPVRSSCWPRLRARAAPSRPEPWPSAKRGCWPVTRRVTVGAQERTGRQVAPLESGPFHVAGSGRSLQGGVPAGGQSGGGRPAAASPSPVCTRTPPAPSWAS